MTSDLGVLRQVEMNTTMASASKSSNSPPHSRSHRSVPKPSKDDYTVVTATIVKKTAYTMTGIGVRKQENGAFLIQKIVENSLFAATKLKVGDEMTSVNFENCIPMTTEDIQEVFKSTVGPITVIARRHNDLAGKVTRLFSSRKPSRSSKENEVKQIAQSNQEDSPKREIDDELSRFGSESTLTVKHRNGGSVVSEDSSTVRLLRTKARTSKSLNDISKESALRRNSSSASKSVASANAASSAKSKLLLTAKARPGDSPSRVVERQDSNQAKKPSRSHSWLFRKRSSVQSEKRVASFSSTLQGKEQYPSTSMGVIDENEPKEEEQRKASDATQGSTIQRSIASTEPLLPSAPKKGKAVKSSGNDCKTETSNTTVESQDSPEVAPEDEADRATFKRKGDKPDGGVSERNDTGGGLGVTSSKPVQKKGRSFRPFGGSLRKRKTNRGDSKNRESNMARESSRKSLAPVPSPNRTSSRESINIPPAVETSQEPGELKEVSDSRKEMKEETPRALSDKITVISSSTEDSTFRQNDSEESYLLVESTAVGRGNLETTSESAGGIDNESIERALLPDSDQPLWRFIPSEMTHVGFVSLEELREEVSSSEGSISTSSQVDLNSPISLKNLDNEIRVVENEPAKNESCNANTMTVTPLDVDIDLNSGTSSKDETVTASQPSNAQNPLTQGLSKPAGSSVGNKTRDDLRAPQTEKVVATVFKKTKDEKTGIVFKNGKGDAVVVARIVEGGMLSNSPFQVGDVIVSVNAIDCREKRAKEIASLVSERDGRLRIEVERRTPTRVPDREEERANNSRVQTINLEPGGQTMSTVPPAGTVFQSTSSDDKNIDVHHSYNMITGSLNRAEAPEIPVKVIIFKPSKSKRTGIAFERQGDGDVHVCKISRGGLFAKTDLRVGDRVVTINNSSCIGRSTKEVAALVKRTKGTLTINARRKILLPTPGKYSLLGGLMRPAELSRKGVLLGGRNYNFGETNSALRVQNKFIGEGKKPEAFKAESNGNSLEVGGREGDVQDAVGSTEARGAQSALVRAANVGKEVSARSTDMESLLGDSKGDEKGGGMSISDSLGTFVTKSTASTLSYASDGTISLPDERLNFVEDLVLGFCCADKKVNVREFRSDTDSIYFEQDEVGSI